MPLGSTPVSYTHLGRAEGRTEGQTIPLIQQMKKKIQKSKTLIQIADELEEEPDTIQSLYEWPFNAPKQPKASPENKIPSVSSKVTIVSGQ